MSIQATCSCGATFKAKSELAGKRVKCPSCGQPFAIPDPRATRPDRTDPFGLPSPGDDPLGLSDLGSMGDPLAQPLPGLNGPATANSLSPAPTLPRQASILGSSKRDKATKVKKHSNLEIATGVLAIYHGGSAAYRAVFAIVAMVKLSSMVGPRAFVSVGMIFFLVGVAISAGILVGGISIFARKESGVQIGVMASYAYFILLAVGFLWGMVSMVRLIGSDVGMLGMRMFVWMIPRMVFDSLGPGLLIFLAKEREH